MPDTPEQLAEKVRRAVPTTHRTRRFDAALSELVARLAAAETERDQAESLAQQIRNRAERAEKDRDEVTVELAKLLAEFKLQRDDRDRLAAALGPLAATAEWLASAYSSGQIVATAHAAETVRAAVRVAREALNPRPDPDLAGDYAAEWKDGEPPNQP